MLLQIKRHETLLKLCTQVSKVSKTFISVSIDFDWRHRLKAL